ncbi:MAG: hypothetical protein ACI9BW_002458, partial [Gammaproteobacteria bacterium]
MTILSHKTALPIACWLSLLSCVATANAAGMRKPAVVSLSAIDAAVSLTIVVGEDGAIEGTMRNNTERKIGDVEILVEYAWIWANDFDRDRAADPGWSMTYTLPVEMVPGSAVPVKIAPLHPMVER